MCNIQKCTKLLQTLISNLQGLQEKYTFRLKSISNLPGLQQCQSLEITLIDSAVLCFAHDKIDGSHLCDGKFVD